MYKDSDILWFKVGKQFPAIFPVDFDRIERLNYNI